ncbi:MAG: hypothetical protein KH019_06925 [Phocaeicola dorei]|nr:hypothetical protein [Phocaeicola dorei]
MSAILSVFSNRELAFLIWLIILLSYFLIKNKWRYHLKRIAISAFTLKLVAIYTTLVIYASIIVILLYLLNIWGVFLLKDTVIWLIFSALGTAFTLNRIKDFGYFTDLIKSNIAVTAIVQFMVNLYSFSLATELIALPVVVFITALSVYSEYYTENDKDYKKAHSCLNKLLIIIGLAYLGFTLYKTIIEFNTTNWNDVAQQFLLPLILTILFIPYYWGLTLYMNYETMFITINVIFRDKDKYERCKIKFYILYYGHLSLKRINRIKHRIAFLTHQDTANYKDYFKKASQAPLHMKSSIMNKMKIELFNNVGGCCKALSDLQLGKFSEWKKLDGLNEFYSITNYYLIKKDGLSNLVLSLQGEELYIHKLELSLSILSPEERNYAISKFQESVLKIVRILSLSLPHDIYNFATKNDCNYNNEIFSLSIKTEIIGNIELFTLAIKSK